MSFVLVVTITCLTNFCVSMRQGHYAQIAVIPFVTEEGCWAAEDAFDEANAQAVQSDDWDVQATCEVME